VKSDSVTIAGQDVPIDYIISQRNKRITVRYCVKKQSIVVRMPQKTKKTLALELILNNTPYFEKFIVAKRILRPGDCINLLGQEYALLGQKSFRNYCEIQGDQIISYYITGLNLNENVKSIARRMLLTYLQTQVPVRAAQISETFNEVSVKNMMSRWGSCSSQRNLNFSLNLAFVPLKCLEYVIVHEVCHLKYMNHSQKFWDLVGQLFPDYKKAREILKKSIITL